MRQPGVEIRPIVQITGDSEFSEVFFDGARTAEANVVGAPGDGWKVAMGTLAFERGASTLGQQLQFQNELQQIIEAAQAQRRGERSRDPPAHRPRVDRVADPALQRAAHAVATRARRAAARGDDHQALLGELAPRPRQARDGRARLDAEIAAGAPYELTRLQRLFLFTRSDTIYAGSNEIQRNLIAERALGLPREPR